MASFRDETFEQDRRRHLRIAAHLLLVIPLLIIVAMALRTVDAERAAQDARASAASENRGSAIGRYLATAMANATAIGDALVSRVLSDGTNEASALRRLVSDGAIVFAVLLRNGRRVFPPEEPAAALVQEVEKLDRFNTALSVAASRAQKDSNGTAWSFIDDMPVLLSCRVEQTQTLCLALSFESIMQLLVERAASKTYPWDVPFEVVDPWSRSRWRSQSDGWALSKAAVVDLAAPMDGWKIRVALPPYPAYHYMVLAISILTPVIIGWGMAFWGLMRRQADQADEACRRAENAACLSHDLRTPLSNFLLYVDLISRNARDDAKVSRYCAVLEEEIARLQAIVGEAVQRARGTPIAITPDKASPDAVIQSLVVRYEPLMKEAGCRVEFEGNAGEVVTTDRSTLERIVVNLLDNARKHAAGSLITIATAEDAGTLLLRVSDEGAKGRANHQGGGAPGFGIGLKIIDKLVKSSGGTFNAIIDAGGSRFSVTLPMQER
ncbi:sensor histidine kinase [Hyphomicrobium denitrificans]|nr:HAMP domain-containing sensor histidine kinase [Hyphomicrobium denitrificans]